MPNISHSHLKTWVSMCAVNITICRVEGDVALAEAGSVREVFCAQDCVCWWQWVPLLQGLWPVGSRAVGPVIQARRAAGNETADLRAEELEQCHMPAACSGSQAQGLHRPHLQPDAAHRHVDGSSPDAKKLWPKGHSCFKIKLTFRQF